MDNLLSRIKTDVESIYGFEVTIFTWYHIRVSDGDKRLDFYPTRYHKLDTGERGDIYDKVDYLSLIHNYFLNG